MRSEGRWTRGAVAVVQGRVLPVAEEAGVLGVLLGGMPRKLGEFGDEGAVGAGGLRSIHRGAGGGGCAGFYPPSSGR